MRTSITTRVRLAVCVAGASAGSLAAAGQQPAAPDLSVKISTPIYRTNGNVDGGSGTWKLQMNQPVVAYPNGGSIFCGPTDAAGWRVEITPVSRSNATVLNVNWQHVSLAAAGVGQQLVGQQLELTALEGRASGSARDLMDLMMARLKVRETEGQLATLTKSSPRGVTQVTLQPGDRTVLDYISTSPRTISPNMATEAAGVTGRPSCDVVGMGLEIALERPAVPSMLVEAELWLVRQSLEGKEETQRQTIRVSPDSPVPFYFDDISMKVAKGFPQFNPGGPPTQEYVDARFSVSGQLSVLGLADGKIGLSVAIGRLLRQSAAAPQTLSSGRAHSDVRLSPGEVLSFQIPNPVLAGATGPGGFALRMRARIINPLERQ